MELSEADIATALDTRGLTWCRSSGSPALARYEHNFQRVGVPSGPPCCWAS